MENYKIEMGGFYIFETITTTIAQVKSILKSKDGIWMVHYRTFDVDGKLINPNIVRSLDRFKTWVKGRVKPRKRIP